MTTEQDAVLKFAHALRKTVQGLAAWATKHVAEAERRGVRRAELQMEIGEIDRLTEALGWGASVGMYGESQCGKSNLVSRLAGGLGAARSSNGGLCIHDPLGSADPGSARPWRDPDHPGIDFIKWVDPGGAGESTGVVCRFTTAQPVAPVGHFRITFISHAELLCALADGYESGVEERDAEARRAGIRDTLQWIRSRELEPDSEQGGTMVQLLDAWRRLARTSSSGARIRDLDTGGTVDGPGWDEFVEECIAKGRRPKLGSRDSSDLKKFVSMLWGGDETLGELWFTLHKDLEKLQGLRNTSVSALEVCKPNETGRSLIDVNWLDELGADEAQKCTVHGVEAWGGESRSVRIKKAVLVALARELVLPIAGGGAADSRFDVIDFPGARAFDKRKQDDSGAISTALAALKRGKLNRLFLSGIDHLDSSVLCLVANCGGNLEAAGIVRQAVHAWLEREGWSGDERPRSDDVDDSVAQPENRPMVLAMTQVDRLLNTPHKAEEKLRLLKDSYAAADIPWMERWVAGRPFDQVFWVYNPEALVGTKRVGYLRSAPQHGKLQEAMSQSELIGRHTASRADKIEALFGESPDADTGLLCERIRTFAAGATARRQPDLACKLLALASREFGTMVSIHTHAPEQEQVVAEISNARKHMEAIRKLRVNELSGLLQCLALSPDLVRKAWNKALGAGVPAEGGPRAAVSFDTFFGALHTVFMHEFEARSLRPDSLWRAALRKLGASEIEAELARKFVLMPGAKWFREALRMQIEPLLDRVNAAQIPKDRLAAVVSARWNRCMTWLDADSPPVPDAVSVTAHPTLRGKEAWNRGIVRHWEDALPKAYRSLIDPDMFSQPWNLEMGANIRRLGAAVTEFCGAVAAFPAEHWAAVSVQSTALAGMIGERSPRTVPSMEGTD